MPAANEATPTARPGYVRGLNYDHPGGLTIKVGRVQIEERNKDGNLVKVWKDGLAIAMYKDQPGIYYAENGRQLTEAHAAAAGFDIEKMRKLRARNQFMAQSAERFDAQNALSGERDVILSREGIQVVALGSDRHIIEDVNGPEPFNLTPNRYLTREDAMAEFARFFGEEPPVSDTSAGAGGAGQPASGAPQFRKASVAK